LSFHSLRKNFATALDNAGATRDDIAALIGHERGFTLETYSGGKGLKALQAIMQRVKYPRLRLQHLYV
jgi:site-specific recombinase XerD